MTQGRANPLRILLVVNLPWDIRLGAVRVYMELAEQWRAAGNVVERYSLSEAFPDTQLSSARLTLRQVLFPHKATAFVRKNGGRFDVIDALIGVLPLSKAKLGFDGLLVARSVGLYRLFDEFDRSVEKLWPGRPKGKFIGRAFYGFARQRLFRDSENAVRNADLINVPNEEEANCLRSDVKADLPIVVQPYGLTDERRQSFRETAAAPDLRLAQKRICFVGMWGARKGARDWSEIIQCVRKRVPGTQFRFLGTMVDSSRVFRDLQLETRDGIELVSAYQLDDLPGLLADCTVGAFPSYAEGFGLAVLEQLAAGIPTVAYDTAGPRDLLGGRLKELLAPKGDVAAFVEKICQVLECDLMSYKELSVRSVESAAGFSWPRIAEQALDHYSAARGNRSAGKILFVQPFSLGSAGGGPRILRALLEGAPFAWESVCTSPGGSEPRPNEISLPSRPNWGRIERTRFAGIAKATAAFFAPSFRRRLKELCLKSNARAIHAVPHTGLDFAEAHAVARELALPFFVSVHDDVAYTSSDRTRRGHRENAMQAAWQESSARFVISEALGREYCRRYGSREYDVVTDGLTELTEPRGRSNSSELRIYFMGLFHMAYERNLRAFLDGLKLFERRHPSVRFTLTCRCEHIRPQVLDGSKAVTILPFASEEQVRRDMEGADLLYLPLPFGKAHEKFARYSLSTKMVSYAGSGVPILYHGPSSSAAYDLLNKDKAAIFITTLVPEEIEDALGKITDEERLKIARNALGLARRDFMLADQSRRFWGALEKATFPE
jgi:glycosyltransferase involved in cell wall biosynthesis